YQERSQRSEARLLADFEAAATGFSEKVGDVIVVDDEDERLTLQGSGSFRAEVVPEHNENEWRTLATPEDLVDYVDPTDVFRHRVRPGLSRVRGDAPASHRPEDCASWPRSSLRAERSCRVNSSRRIGHHRSSRALGPVSSCTYARATGRGWCSVGRSRSTPPT